MDGKLLRIHLLWGGIVLIVTAVLGVPLAMRPEPEKQSRTIDSAVPKPQRAAPGFEDELAAQLADQTPVSSIAEGPSSFPDSLTRAIGMAAFELSNAPEGAVHTTETGRVEGGELARLQIHFDRPKIHTQAWLWHHPQRARQLVVLLHGHNTTARGALGLEGEDYMRGVGRDFFDWGADVLAFDLSSDGVVSGYINARLSLFGGQIYGLWTAAVCAGTRATAAQGGYEEVVLYGLSNGGFVADIASVLCDGFDRVIVDDILADLPVHVAANTNMLFQHQQYSIYFLSPFLATLDFRDFLRHSQADKVYTRTRAHFEEHLEQSLLQAFVPSPLAASSALRIIFKRENEHAPEKALLQAILFDNLADLEGISLQERNSVDSKR